MGAVKAVLLARVTTCPGCNNEGTCTCDTLPGGPNADEPKEPGERSPLLGDALGWLDAHPEDR